MFLLEFVILFTRDLPQCMLAHPPLAHPTWHTPLWHTTLWHTPLAPPPPQGADPPPEADPSIRSMSDRYASYWNAFLFFLDLHSFSPQPSLSLGVNGPLPETPCLRQ